MTPNPERAKNILTQIELRLEVAKEGMIPERHSTLIIEAYYEIIKELLTALLAVDGYKSLSHITLIEYLRTNYVETFAEHEIRAIDELRKIRNRIVYEGFMLTKNQHDRKAPTALSIIAKLKEIINTSLAKDSQS